MTIRNGSSLRNEPPFLAFLPGAPPGTAGPPAASAAGSLAGRTSAVEGTGATTVSSSWGGSPVTSGSPSVRGRGLALLLDLGLLAAQGAQIVELGPAYVATSDQFDVVDDR